MKLFKPEKEMKKSTFGAKMNAYILIPIFCH